MWDAHAVKGVCFVGAARGDSIDLTARWKRVESGQAADRIDQS